MGQFTLTSQVSCSTPVSRVVQVFQGMSDSEKNLPFCFALLHAKVKFPFNQKA